MKKYNFEQFNTEINEFYKFCKENKCTDEEIRKVLAPIIVKKQEKLLIILVLVVIFGIGYVLSHFETISWNASALGRIALIKLLPIWDWTRLKNEKCLIYKENHFTETVFNCDMCENVNSIDFYNEIDEQVLQNRYLDVDIPLIVRNNKNWPKSTNFIHDLAANDVISDSIPCLLATNTQNKWSTVGEALRRADEFFDSFFLHFQNCDFEAMKEFRSFTPKFTQFPVEFSPVQYNWLVWSRNYNVSSYKKIDLIERVTFFGQISGRNYIKLTPRNNCRKLCRDLEFFLDQNEGLIFTSLWNLEYKPDAANAENIAAILEMH